MYGVGYTLDFEPALAARDVVKPGVVALVNLEAPP